MNMPATELPNFVRKYYLLHELLIFKYWRQKNSVSNIALQRLHSTYCSQALRRPAHRARETVHLLTHETSDFITPALWPANSPDLNPVDYQIWGKLQEHVYRSQIRDLDQLKSRLIEEWEHFHQVVIDEAVRKWRPHLRACFDFEHTVDVLNPDFRCAEVLPFARQSILTVQTVKWQSITPVPIVDTYAFGWPY